MKRDWDVIREVLLEVESIPNEARVTFAYCVEPGQDDASRIRADHAFLLAQAGFISGLNASDLGGNVLLGPALTWEGHDLLSALRSKPVLERAKVIAAEKGIELTLDAFKAISKIALDYVLR
jgi:hypothetical protein